MFTIPGDNSLLNGPVLRQRNSHIPEMAGGCRVHGVNVALHARKIARHGLIQGASHAIDAHRHSDDTGQQHGREQTENDLVGQGQTHTNLLCRSVADCCK